jgi:thiamine-monophosphate kinase
VTGGEDYELLFAVPPKRRRAFTRAMAKAGSIAITKVGVLTVAMQCVFSHGESAVELPSGFQHFGNK